MGKKEKSPLDMILNVYDNLHDAEKKIADFVIGNQAKVVDMIVSELSKSSGVSEATVVRFCKKCGFKGYHHLKIQLAKEMVEEQDRNISNVISIDNISQSLQNILANKVEEMKQTISMINADNLKSILNIIKKSRVIQFVALGNSIPIALDATYKFNQLGIRAVTNTIFETQLALAYTLTFEDTVFVVSSSGASKKLLTLVDIANQQGANTICITNHDTSPLALKCKYQLNTYTREKLFLSEYTFTKIPATIIIEILFLLLVSYKEDAYSCISKHESSMADDKI